MLEKKFFLIKWKFIKTYLFQKLILPISTYRSTIIWKKILKIEPTPFNIETASLLNQTG